jgi:hypothetical protein
MANPIIRIKRGATAPVATLNAGEFAIDQAAKNLYLGVEVGGVTTNEIVGGEGTFATKTYVGNAITTATGNLGTMSTQNADSVAITGGTMDGVSISMGTVFGTNLQTVAIGSSSYIADSTIENTPIGATTPSTGAFTTLTASSAPSNDTDVVRKTDLDARISSLGTIFKYIGYLNGGVDEASAYDLSVLDVGGGEFYRVATAGFFAGAGGASGPYFYANQGDGILFDIDGASEHIDNTNTQVAGTANEIAVSGSTDTGYTVAIDSAFSGRVNNLEIKTEYQSQGHYNSNSYTKISSDEVIGGDFWVTTGGTDPEAGNDVFRVENNSAQVFVNSAGIPSGGLFVSGSASVEDGGTGDGGHLTVEGNVTAGGTVSGTNITDLETKTQNISLTGTTAGVTNFNGQVLVNSPGIPSGGLFVGGHFSVEDAGGFADIIISADSNGIVLGGQYGGAPPSALNIECRHNLVGVNDHNNSAMMNIKNFVIDGGTF